MKKKNRLCVIPPLTQNLVIAGSILLVSVLTFNVRSPISYQYWQSEFHIGVSVIALLFLTPYYVVYEDALILWLFFIPIRRIKLEKVSSATYFAPHSIKQGKRTEGYASILLTLSPCPPFLGTGDDVYQFDRKHMLHTVRIKLNTQNVQDARTSLYICLSHYGKTLKS